MRIEVLLRTIEIIAQVEVAGTEIGFGSGLAGGALSTFLTTVIFGGILLLLAPEYTRARISEVSAEPVGSFITGIAVLIAVLVLMILLVLTIIGILAVIPLGIIVFFAWAIGSAIAYLAIGDRIVGHDEGWWPPLLVGAGINGLLALTGIGGIFSFAIGAAGFGTIVRRHLL